MYLRLTLCLLIFILPLLESTVYLYNTHDKWPLAFFDCIIEGNLPYCRRPLEPIPLQRDQSPWYCEHGGISHHFSSLLLNNVSVSAVLHGWRSSIEKAEEYARYIKQREYNETRSSDEKYLCQCTNPQSFGKHCEYWLPVNMTFQETIMWEFQMKKENIWKMHRYSDIVCYTTLICDSGLLCLDWRDICDGIQHCMYGYDEENCDTLEFNECEDDEYRCANGMCIPDQYFLDGEYDCADLTDEKGPFDDRKCTFEPASYECDDRICLRSQWSCGDGQCILSRLDFQTERSSIECSSLRDQYHMCEMHVGTALQWTLPNGKCYRLHDYEEDIGRVRTDVEECLYFVKCALSEGLERNCPCKQNVHCMNNLQNPCSSSTIPYPNGAIIAPYVFTFYNTVRDWFQWIPDIFIIDGTLKCRGYMIKQNTTINYRSRLNLTELEATVCALKSNGSVLSNGGYDQLCYNNCRTFNNRSYHLIDVCKQSKECISAYRIKDGNQDCSDFSDELFNDQYPNTCINIQRHRFRCSKEQPSCLLAHHLGNEIVNCLNDRDEWWMTGGIKLSNLICNSQSKDDCERIRQYIETSSNFDGNNIVDQRLGLTKIPFRTFCDTFWNWGSKEDEDIQMCHTWWKCLPNQWQCRSGQCIDVEWVLDGEWDCVDASDEQALFFPSNDFFSANLNLISNEILMKKFNILYGNQSFWDICNLSMEYPCFRADVVDPFNLIPNRPCINLAQIGDGHIDCAGGIDERNTLKHCHRHSIMLGNFFQCSSIEVCVSYFHHCPSRCDNNHVQCFGYNQTSNCSNEADFMCLDGRCAKDGRCRGDFDCSHGEDELFCVNRDRKGFIDINPSRFYRDDKERLIRTTNKIFRLPQLLTHVHQTKVPTMDFTRGIESTISYDCNRGVGIHLNDERSYVCFCPPQYYGDRCQFHNDRITFLFHLNFSQSTNPKMKLTLLVVFLHDNEPLMSESIQIEMIVPQKQRVQLFYPRFDSYLEFKRSRYFNRSNIINEHPYSIRIEGYQLIPSEKARLVAVWLYPIYFDFLPSFHLSKILHLTKPDSLTNPCSTNPCNSLEECHPILNQKSSYVCLCPPDFKGENCSIKDEMCESGFCSSNALCKATYGGMLNGYGEPICICSVGEIGERCHLIDDRCDSNPCENNGTCRSTRALNRLICLCDQFHYGDQCQLDKEGVRIEIKNTPKHRAAVVQYLNIDLVTLDLILVDQHIYNHLPDLLNYLYVGKTPPNLILIKFYSGIESILYLISNQINGTTELNETNHCVSVETLLLTTEIHPIKYHYLCIENPHLLCFNDHSYLCICGENPSRTDCFGYDDNLDQCSSCLSGGKCLRESRLKPGFICLCPRCYYGSVCQFNIQGIGFTLDSLIIQLNRSIRWMYFIFALLMFTFGGMMNYANIVTFKRPNLRKTSMSIYMIMLALLSQYSLFSLIGKIVLILFDSLMNNLSCKIISYLHSVSIRCSFWLTSWIAIERVSYVVFPYSIVMKKARVAALISCLTILAVSLMHIHELFFYRKLLDLNGHSSCIVDFPLKLILTYDRVSVLIHYLIPFCIQILSVTVLIILAARSRSRTGNHRDRFIEYLKRQFQSQKDLYIPPVVIILSSLPQLILSFSFACLELIDWQQHLLLIAYFLSFAPQLLSFVLYVLPSSIYRKEFQGTKLSKTILFRWIISRKD